MALNAAPPPLTVTVRSARVAYGAETLFDGLDVTLPGGRWTCLLGPSGVGKSTLLRLILGLVAGVETAAEDGVVCSDRRPLAGRAAFMAQTDLLFPWLSVLGNVDLGRRLRGGPRRARDAEERARALLDRVGLGANAGDLPTPFPAACGSERRSSAP